MDLRRMASFEFNSLGLTVGLLIVCECTSFLQKQEPTDGDPDLWGNLGHGNLSVYYRLIENLTRRRDPFISISQLGD